MAKRKFGLWQKSEKLSRGGGSIAISAPDSNRIQPNQRIFLSAHSRPDGAVQKRHFCQTNPFCSTVPQLISTSGNWEWRTENGRRRMAKRKLEKNLGASE